MTQDTRKKNKEQVTIWFKNVYADFLQDKKGYTNILDYIKGEYNGDKEYYSKVARWAGHKCIRRNGVYYFEA